MNLAKIDSKDKLNYLNSFLNGFKLYLFLPKLTRLVPSSGRTFDMSCRKFLRFIQMFGRGYRIYLMTNSNDEVIGSACFCNGGLKRYTFADKHDLILGPYFIVPCCRGQGFATSFIQEIIKNHEKKYASLYAHVWYQNEASIKVLEKVGFKRVGTFSTTRITSKFIKNENGKNVLFKM